MQRKFVMLPEFDKQWKAMGLSDDDLARLQREILSDPKAGDVIRGTGGLRKYRFAFEGRGKSGSSRVIYVDFVLKEIILLVTAYPKNEKDNLTQAERNAFKKLIEIIEENLK